MSETLLIQELIEDHSRRRSVETTSRIRCNLNHCVVSHMYAAASIRAGFLRTAGIFSTMAELGKDIGKTEHIQTMRWSISVRIILLICHELRAVSPSGSFPSLLWTDFEVNHVSYWSISDSSIVDVAVYRISVLDMAKILKYK